MNRKLKRTALIINKNDCVTLKTGKKADENSDLHH